MCGIAGLLEQSDSARAFLSRMLALLSHRGPDDEGIWLEPRSGMALGHRRLSIIDVSAAGHQPMASASGRYVITYNGEIYNYAELRKELERIDAAPSWHGHSDTEVLLAGFDAWGIARTIERCNGMFALAVWDAEHQSLTLARDRMGEKPLYFGWVGGRFAFASELKAFSALPGWAARMAPEAIAAYLGTGYVRGPQSAVLGIYRLPAGCLLTLSQQQLQQPRDWDWLSARLSRYWSLGQVAADGMATPLVDNQASLDALASLLADAVQMRMVADVPLGAFLSGGIDSSLVVALMQAHAPRRIRTFSIGFEEATHDEAPFARAVARHLGTDHTELYASPQDALALVPSLATTFDEPFADSSQIPTMLVSALTRQHVTVALSGDGGDELFAGYGRYFAILGLWRWIAPLPAALRRRVAPALSLLAGAAGPFARTLPGARSIPFRLERLAERLEADGPDALRLAFIGGAGASRTHAAPQPGHAHALPPSQLQDTLRRLMYADQLDYLADDILHKVDRASMAYGLESRIPFLDHRVVELSWRLPTAMLVRNGQGKQPLRRILDRYVPRQLIDRPKQGFAPPMDAWLRGPLRDWAESLLKPDVLRELPFMNPPGVQDLWRSHLDGRIDGGITLWKVLMLADWQRRFGAGH